MDPEVPQEPQEQQPPQEPETQPPSIDPNIAIQVAAQHYGVDPSVLVDSLRLQEENKRVYEENRRTRRELEIERAKIEAVQQATRRYEPPPTYDDIDPVSRRILERMDKQDERWNSWERQQRQKEEERIRVQEMGTELVGHYNDLMRRVPSQNQIDQAEFFERHMVSLYPSGVPEGITPAQAVYNTAKWLGLNVSGNGAAPTGYAPQRSIPTRDPRAQFVVPMTGSSAPNAGAPLPGQDFAPQRPNETTEQYHQRLLRSFQDIGTMRLPDGAKVSSG